MFGFLVGFRKFLIMLVFIAIMVIFRLYNLVDGEQFSSNVQIAIVAFFGTNVGEHLLNLGKEWVKGKINNEE